jgi:ribose 5-phosphate isomerase RpiB
MGANRQAHIRCALAQDVVAHGRAANNNDANVLMIRRRLIGEAKECVPSVVEHGIRRQ